MPLAKSLNDQPIEGLQEAVPSYDTLALFGRLPVGWEAVLESRIQSLNTESVDTRHHRVPVCFELGVDLAEVGLRLELSSDELIELFCDPCYQVVAMGFQPGFPYLSGLLPELQGLPRRPEPRLRVPKGSVGITLNQAGIYPAEVPGGWHLIGQTPVELVTDENASFFFEVGDTLKFEVITPSEFHQMVNDA